MACVALQSPQSFWRVHDWVYQHQSEINQTNLIEMIEAHLWSIDLKERSDGRHGAWFRLSLPLASAPLLSKSAVSKPITLASIK